MSRRALQVVTGLLGAIPIATGCIGLLGLRDPLYVRCGIPVSLDSNLRFYSGLWLGLGIAMYSILPSVEQQTVLFRAFWGAIFLGGFGRLASIVGVGAPPLPFLGVIGLERVGAPVFIVWQRRVALGSATLTADRTGRSKSG